MAFNSFAFWIVYPFLFLIYWVIPSKYIQIRNAFLLIISYLLYMNWEPVYALILLGVTVITYLGGTFLDYFNMACNLKTKRKILCGSFTILALFPLLVFKYYTFLNANLIAGMKHFGVYFALPGLNWAIPVGISFFTFQAVGYLLDVYHHRVKAEKNFLNYSLFISFFPQITSGPISTVKELMPQLKTTHTFNDKLCTSGLKILLWGMFLKCVIADRLGLYVDIVYSDYEHFSGLNCFIASLFYTIQIYGDFAGYSLMSIGIAKTLGFNLIDNFRQPYFATSITEFWKRWHISLTRWLTTHIYINLGGNRCSKLRQYFNIMITFLVSGLWHGANWTFVMWGVFHGLLQIIEKALGIAPRGRYSDKIDAFHGIKFLRIILTFLMVNFTWILFRMPTISDAWYFITSIFTNHCTQPMLYGVCNSDILFMAIAVICLFAVEVRKEFLSDKMLWLDSKVCRWVLYTLAFCMILSIGVLDASSFIYVSF